MQTISLMCSDRTGESIMARVDGVDMLGDEVGFLLVVAQGRGGQSGLGSHLGDGQLRLGRGHELTVELQAHFKSTAVEALVRSARIRLTPWATTFDKPWTPVLGPVSVEH